MACDITIPRLGWNMEEGIFIGWLKSDGQPVKAGEPLFNLEGDKTTQEIESLESGILRISPDGPKDGDKVAVGTIVGYLVASGEPAPFESRNQQTEIAASSPAAQREAEIKRNLPTSFARKQRKPISPRARRVARELGIDPASINGSGKTGRIIERDIRAATAAVASLTTRPAPTIQDRPSAPSVPASSTDYHTLAVTSIRKTIAARMLESSQRTAAVTITTTVDATNLVNLRRQFKAVTEGGQGQPIGYTEIIVKLTALALAKHPMLNCRWSESEIQVWHRVHIGIAVDTDAGLMVPVVRDVPDLSLREIAARARDLINRARTGKLSASELSGGTFTVTNLGQFGVEAFTPLINPPECAILGLGRIQNQVVVHNKQFAERDRMVLSLTFDHRITDGAPAARFLQTLGSLIENPSPWLLS
jgi:pyruvate dehydrogenase E2 component (dihydrolipoamide acetyltransferase)